ncbi:hypothetical protein Taro_002450 [Colocasia esculenta]|uniref:Uncharacterized protein n=1 Tax=Colocasia esculenta TaxID=4460 RepID=A0A843TE53_COLES|nr:hypothetical protein [Colocasia esculenta]
MLALCHFGAVDMGARGVKLFRLWDACGGLSLVAVLHRSVTMRKVWERPSGVVDLREAIPLSRWLNLVLFVFGRLACATLMELSASDCVFLAHLGCAVWAIGCLVEHSTCGCVTVVATRKSSAKFSIRGVGCGIRHLGRGGMGLPPFPVQTASAWGARKGRLANSDLPLSTSVNLLLSLPVLSVCLSVHRPEEEAATAPPLPLPGVVVAWGRTMGKRPSLPSSPEEQQCRCLLPPLLCIVEDDVAVELVAAAWGHHRRILPSRTPVLVAPLRVVSEPRVRPSSSLESHGAGQLDPSHCLALHGSGAVSGGQTWDRSPARLRLVVVFVHASHSNGRGDLDSWLSVRGWVPCWTSFVKLIPPLLPFRFEFEGAGARVQTVCVVPLVVNSVNNGYNRLVDHVGIHDQRRPMEALCKGSLVRRKEYPTESSPQAKVKISKNEEEAPRTPSLHEILSSLASSPHPTTFGNELGSAKRV